MSKQCWDRYQRQKRNVVCRAHVQEADQTIDSNPLRHVLPHHSISLYLYSSVRRRQQQERPDTVIWGLHEPKYVNHLIEFSVCGRHKVKCNYSKQGKTSQGARAESSFAIYQQNVGAQKCVSGELMASKSFMAVVTQMLGSCCHDYSLALLPLQSHPQRLSRDPAVWTRDSTVYWELPADQQKTDLV